MLTSLLLLLVASTLASPVPQWGGESNKEIHLLEKDAELGLELQVVREKEKLAAQQCPG
jgi:hypothetical protein